MYVGGVEQCDPESGIHSTTRNGVSEGTKPSFGERTRLRSDARCCFCGRIGQRCVVEGSREVPVPPIASPHRIQSLTRGKEESAQHPEAGSRCRSCDGSWYWGKRGRGARERNARAVGQKTTDKRSKEADEIIHVFSLI